MKRSVLALGVLGALVGAAACGDDGGGDGEGGNGADAGDTGGDNGGNGNGGTPACGLDAASSKGDATTGTIKGTVTLGKNVKAGGSYAAKGDLYIAVMGSFSAACPGAADAPVAVAQTLIRCVDLTDGKTVEYEVQGVPPRAEPYVVIPFVDVNDNVDPSKPETAGPDACDLLGAVPPPSGTVAKAGDVTTLDLSLASDASLLQSICALDACE
jgi:hypothetical protein